MIRVSTRGRYALRAMVDVALYSGRQPVLRQDIAERQHISADYVAQLFSDLRRAGLVEGVKGPGGGYRLARDPAEITAGDVISAVEGPVAVVGCAAPSDNPACSRIDRCVTHSLWKRLSESISRLLDSVTLEAMREEARRLEEGHV